MEITPDKPAMIVPAQTLADGNEINCMEYDMEAPIRDEIDLVKLGKSLRELSLKREQVVQLEKVEGIANEKMSFGSVKLETANKEIDYKTFKPNVIGKKCQLFKKEFLLKTKSLSLLQMVAAGLLKELPGKQNDFENELRKRACATKEKSTFNNEIPKGDEMQTDFTDQLNDVLNKSGSEHAKGMQLAKDSIKKVEGKLDLRKAKCEKVRECRTVHRRRRNVRQRVPDNTDDATVGQLPILRKSLYCNPRGL